MHTRHDAVVVGAGPIGITVARRLAEGGMRVSVFEGGPAITDPPGSHFRNTTQFREAPDSYFSAIGRFIDPASDDAKSSLPGVGDSALYGGQGILWTNNCPRAVEFERWGALSADAWEKKYREAEMMLGVISDPSRQSKTGQAVVDRLRSTLAKERRVVRGLPLAGRVLDSGDFYFNAPWDVLQGAAAEVRERIRIQGNTRVSRLHFRNRQLAHVELEGSGVRCERVQTPLLVLAGGALATPRLLHGSAIRPAGLGRGLSFHGLLFGQVVLESGLFPGAAASDIAPRIWIPPTSDSPWHIQVLRDTCPLPASEAVDNPHRLLEFQAFVPMEFRDENAFLIAEDDNSQFRFSFSDPDRERMRAAEADVRRLAAELGPWRRGCELMWLPHGSAHLVGTCVMDMDGRRGVTNRQGRVHGFDNLYLATVGLIPSPVAVNPTLTATALALGTCDHILSGG